MKCKNCGTEIVPGALRCPTCNIEYSKSDALDIPDTPNRDQIDDILVDDRVEEVKEVPEAEKIVEIQAIDMPEASEVTIPVVNDVSTQSIASQSKYEDTKKSGLLPEERGGNKLFLFFAILLLLGAGGFFAYAKFVNPEIINEVMYYLNPDLKKKEEKPFVSSKIDFNEIKKYNTEDGSLDYLNEVLTLVYNNVEKIEGTNIILYKETLENKPLVSDAQEQITKNLEQYTINDTFKISVTENKNMIILSYTQNLNVATSEEIATESN